MNELVNFARQALERRHNQDGGENPSVTVPSQTEHSSDWLNRWRELAQVTSGLLTDDPRLTPVLSALALCDRCYRDGDVDGFTKGAARVHRLMQLVPGSTVIWEGSVNHRLTTLGPAVVELVCHDDGKLYVFVVWKGTERWIEQTIITNIEGPKGNT